jgi:hypothetical protein
MFTSRLIWLTLEKAKLTSLAKCIARQTPVVNWTIRQSPRSDPKFHIDEIFAGVGSSIREP